MCKGKGEGMCVRAKVCGRSGFRVCMLEREGEGMRVRASEGEGEGESMWVIRCEGM